MFSTHKKTRNEMFRKKKKSACTLLLNRGIDGHFSLICLVFGACYGQILCIPILSVACGLLVLQIYIIHLSMPSKVLFMSLDAHLLF